jgi:peptide/nickel transport system substrate-binding protein
MRETSPVTPEPERSSRSVDGPAPGSDLDRAALPLPSRRGFLAGTAAVGGAIFGGGLLAGCGTGNDSSGKKASGRSGKNGETLFIAGFQWGPPSNFNPLGTSAAWPCGQNNVQLIYETLVRFNLLDGSLQPGLATGIKDTGPTTMSITLQKGTKWQDGKALTADDVVYTFGLAKKHPEISYATFWDYVDSIEKASATTVTVNLKKAPLNPGMVRNYLATTFILPEHIWTPIEAANKTIGNYTNLKPVGSGPYQINLRDQTQIGMVRFDGYWGKSVFGTPAPKYVLHPVYKDNTAGDLAFQNGDVDVSQQFTPQVWKMWTEKKKPISTWYDKTPYDIPGGMPMLVMNTSKKGLDNPSVRRAIAHCIDYAHIAKTAMSSYSVPAKSSVILPTGSEQKYFNDANVTKYGWKFDTKEAKRILEEDLKAKKGSDGIYKLPDGTRLGPWVVQTPTGWTDWQSALEIVVANAKSIGIDITTKFPQAPQVTQAVQNGDFDLACWSVAGVSPATPWQRFRDVLDSRGVPAPGKNAFYNYGRFKDPAVAALLDKAGTASSDAELKSALGDLDMIFMKNAPMIPLMYRPLEFFEFNRSTWTGFPDSKNPYAPPMWQGAGISWFFKIKRAGGK